MTPDPLKGERRRIIEQIRAEVREEERDRLRKKVEGMKEIDTVKTFTQGWNAAIDAVLAKLTPISEDKK